MSETPVEVVRRLESQHPALPWRRPTVVLIVGVGGSDYVCRFCVAHHGLRGQAEPGSPDHIGSHPQTREEFDRHMRDVHGVEPEPEAT